MVLNASNIQSRGGGLAILIEMQTKFYDIFDPISVAFKSFCVLSFMSSSSNSNSDQNQCDQVGQFLSSFWPILLQK